MSIDKVRVSVEEALGEGTPGAPGRNGIEEGGQGRCRGLFEFEADDVSGQQVRWGILLPTQCPFEHVVTGNTGASLSVVAENHQTHVRHITMCCPQK